MDLNPYEPPRIPSETPKPSRESLKFWVQAMLVATGAMTGFVAGGGLLMLLAEPPINLDVTVVRDAMFSLGGSAFGLIAGYLLSWPLFWWLGW